MNLNYVLQIIQNLWENPYIKAIMFYLLYVVILFWIILPLSKKFIVSFVKRTKTNLDNEIYGKIKVPLKILLFLLGLNIIYVFYITVKLFIYKIMYNILSTVEFILVYVILQRISKTLEKYSIRKFSQIITKNIANVMKIFSNIVVFSIVGLLILKVWGINITPLLASAGIFGFAVAMASKAIIENFLSGLILLADKSINVGDVIILSDGSATVVDEINIRTTRLKTFDGNVVIVPNSKLLNEKIVNKSLSDISSKKRVSVTIGISYGDDVEKAKKLMESYLKEIDGVDESTITTYVDALADWSVNITGKAMVDANKWSYLLEKQILEKAYKEFPKNGLNFPFPTYELTGSLSTNK